VTKKLFLAVLFFIAVCIATAYSQPVKIEVFKDHVLEKSYIGNGVQWSAYPSRNISEKSWQRVFDRLDFMKLNFIRLMVDASDYCQTYPPLGTPVYTFDNDKIKRVLRILHYCQKNGVDVILGEWDNPAGKNREIDPTKKSLKWDGFRETDPRWTEMVGEFIRFLVNDKKYTCIKYYNLGNEPNGYWMSCESFETWRISILNLHKELVKRGLDKNIKIVGPDCAWGNDWIKKIIADKELAAAIDTYEVHWYATAKEIEDAEFEKEMTYYRDYITKNDPDGKTKQFFMGEAGMLTGKNDFDQQKNIATFQYGVWIADFAVQSMRAGQAGLIAWDLDDAMHTSRKHGTGDEITDYTWKEWGFWDSFGEEKGKPELTNLRPWFYTWSLLSKYIPKGSQVLKTSDTGIPGLRSTASKVMINGKFEYTFVIVNESKTQRTINLVCDNPENLTLNQFNYFETDRPADYYGFPVVKATLNNTSLKGGILIEIPSNGVIVLTSLK